MKRILNLIFILITLIMTIFIPAGAVAEPFRVLSVHYDDSSSLLYLVTDATGTVNEPVKYVRLSSPNRVYFDVEGAVLAGEKQHILFEHSSIKELRLAQFSTNPDIVRMVITFEEGFDTSKVRITNTFGNILVRLLQPELTNDYFGVVYDENPQKQKYVDLSAFSQVIKREPIPQKEIGEGGKEIIGEIQKAFEDSTLLESDGKTYETTVSVDLTSSLKLRTKYHINKYIPKNKGLLISGMGQVSVSKLFLLKAPDRVVVDMPNTYLEKGIRNREVNLCPDNSCSDVAKIGQFDTETARVVITTDTPEKYMMIYSQDGQSLFLVNSDKLNHTAMTSTVANINKAYVRRIDSKTNEMILSFTAPVVHSIVRTDSGLTLFLFNVRSYNEQDLIKTFNGTFYKPFTLSLLPQTGVRGVMPGLGKEDTVKIEESADAKALRVTITKNSPAEIRALPDRPSRRRTKDKIVLDPGHGGTDYGAIREGINEKDITLDIAKRVETLLRARGYRVALTRTDDTFVSLEDRVDFSEKEEPEIFVSIHVNSAVATAPNGIETHWYHDYSKPLAEVIHKHLVKEISNAKDRGLFKSKFYVINHTTDPAVLCEIGFISNEEERNDLITEARKQKTAKAIAEGIIEYIKANSKK